MVVEENNRFKKVQNPPPGSDPSMKPIVVYDA